MPGQNDKLRHFLAHMIFLFCSKMCFDQREQLEDKIKQYRLKERHKTEIVLLESYVTLVHTRNG